MKILSLTLILILFTMPLNAQKLDESFLESNKNGLKLTEKGASHFAKLALNCIQQEFPNKLGHVMDSTGDWKNPQDLHPAFYGCYDWHSAVHGHWMLVRLLKRFPNMPETAQIRQALSQNLTAANILAEKSYFERPSAKSYERTYGWAWLLKLAEELHTWQEDKDAQKWYKNLQPLCQLIVERYEAFLPKQTYPIRTGVHPNTAFGIWFALDYARQTENESLKKLLLKRSRDYYLQDQNCPTDWEPNGADFFSPCLLEAALMSKVLHSEDYKKWLKTFMPKLANSDFRLLQPAIVADRSDLQIVHLDGLNLSRVWCFNAILPYLNSQTQAQVKSSIRQHLEQTLVHIANGDYAGEHWLASFAIYALTE